MTTLAISGLMGLASRVMDLGQGIFSSDPVWDVYKLQINVLRGKLESIVEDHDLQDDEMVNSCVQGIQSILKNAETHLEGVKWYADIRVLGGCSLYRSSVLAYASRTLEKRTQYLEKAYTMLDRLLNEQSAKKPKVASDNPLFSEQFVPLTYHNEVWRALKDDSRYFVFLYGDQGIGKTTLAWHIAAESKRRGENLRASSQATDSARTSGDTSGNLGTSHREAHSGVNRGNPGTSRQPGHQATDPGDNGRDQVSRAPRAFSHVFFISCGATMDSNALKEEMKRRLGLQSEAHDIFEGLGKKSKILLILDDVQDTSIPQWALTFGRDVRVRILITSHNGSICQGCPDQKIHRIHLEIVGKENAKKILINHVGLSLPQTGLSVEQKNIIKYIDRIVEETGEHPLALSCVASYMSEDKVNEAREWKSALQTLQKALQLDSQAHLHGEKYPRSFWGMMKLCTQGLGGAGKVLLLFHVLKKKPGREDVVRLLYLRLGLGTDADFREARRILKSRNLITTGVQESFWPENSYQKWVWDIHPLRRLYIETEGVGDGLKRADLECSIREGLNVQTWENVATSLAPVYRNIQMILSHENMKQEDVVRFILCCMYLDTSSILPHWMNKKMNSRDFRLEKLLFATKPLGELLVKLSEESMTDLQAPTEQMILYVILEKEFNGQDVFPLFQNDMAAPYLLRLFERAAYVERAAYSRYGTFFGLFEPQVFCFLLEVTLETRKLSLQGEATLILERIVDQAYRVVMTKIGKSSAIFLYPRIVQLICDILWSSPDIKQRDVCYRVLLEISNRVMGIITIMRESDIIPLAMKLVRGEYTLWCKVLLT